MNRWLLALVLLVPLLGCKVETNPNRCPDGGCDINVDVDVSAVDFPAALRQRNWTVGGKGSCMHASWTNCLRSQGLWEQADWHKSRYGGPESIYGLRQKIDHLTYSDTTTGSSEFLEQCDRTRRWALIYYFPNHAINFCGYEDGKAVLLDNNNTSRYIRIDKQLFLARWRGYGGVAAAPCYSPLPPKPFVTQCHFSEGDST